VAFTDDELAYLRTKLGSTVNEDTNPDIVDDLETRYDRLGDVRLVAVEVLRQRLADIADALNNPLNFSIPGEYSQDASGNIAYLTRMLADVEQEAGVPGDSVMTSVSPRNDRWCRGHLHRRHPDIEQYRDKYYWGR
jgi:hypothetical protein